MLRGNYRIAVKGMIMSSSSSSSCHVVVELLVGYLLTTITALWDKRCITDEITITGVYIPLVVVVSVLQEW
jgi:hypothetical protein